MKKILLLLADGFEIYEASAFIDVLGWNKEYGTPKTQLYTCGLTKTLNSTFGIKLDVDFTIDKINANEYDAIAIPGGFEVYGFYNDAFSIEFKNLIVKFNELDKIISSICVGALPIGKSGILQNRKATTYNQMEGQRLKQLEDFGAEIVNEPIVSDSNVTTSWGPSTAVDVAFDLLEKLTSLSNANHIRKLMGFDK
jgi:protein deglycase